jgi:hypothetical protein
MGGALLRKVTSMPMKHPLATLVVVLTLQSASTALARGESDSPPVQTDPASPTMALGSIEKNPISTCLACHQDTQPKSIPEGSPFEPLLPRQFSVEWYYFNVRSETPPPYGALPDTDTRGHGVTHYDWDRKSMIEIYEDVCVNRFPSGHKFPCRFLHVGGTAYYMTFEKSAYDAPKSCCVLLKPPFYPVRPDFVSLQMTYQKRMSFDHKDTDWWLLDVHYPSRYFGYGFDTKTREPVAFWYRVLDGWGQQNFYNLRKAQPDPALFEVPAMCQEAKLCNTTRAGQ